MERKTEKDQLILKRRQMRAERKKKLEEKLTKAKTMLIRDEKGSRKSTNLNFQNKLSCGGL